MFVLEVTISLSLLLHALLVLAGVAALIALTVVLINLAKSLKALALMMNKMEPSLTETVEQLPATVLKVQSILDDGKKITEAAGESVPELVKSASEAGQTLTNTVGILGSGAESLSASLVSVLSKPLAKKAKEDKKIALDIESELLPGLGIKAGKADISKLSQYAGTAIGAYRFFKKFKKMKKKKARKSKFGF